MGLVSFAYFCVRINVKIFYFEKEEVEMRSKRILAIVLCMILSMSFMACGSSVVDKSGDKTKKSEAPKATDTPKATEAATNGDLGLIKKGTLSVGVEIGYPPFEQYAEDGTTPIGFDIDFAKALSQKMGVEVNFINTGWETIFAGIGTNYDVVISCVTINDERKQTMDFSDPYVNSYQSIVVKKGSTLTFNSLKDLDGKSVGLQKETTSDETIKKMISTGTIKATVVGSEKIITCFTQLDNGEIDAVLCDSIVSDGYVGKEPEKYVKIFQDESAPEQFGVAIKKGNKTLQDAINKAIKELKDEGFFDKNYEKWLGKGE